MPACAFSGIVWFGGRGRRHCAPNAHRHFIWGKTIVNLNTCCAKHFISSTVPSAFTVLPFPLPPSRKCFAVLLTASFIRVILIYLFSFFLHFFCHFAKLNVYLFSLFPTTTTTTLMRLERTQNHKLLCIFHPDWYRQSASQPTSQPQLWSIFGTMKSAQQLYLYSFSNLIFTGHKAHKRIFILLLRLQVIRFVRARTWQWIVTCAKKIL